MTGCRRDVPLRRIGRAMGDVIHLAERLRTLFGSDDLSHEKFLLEEGLDLLAAYRSIEDADLRKAIRQLVMAAARSLAETKNE